MVQMLSLSTVSFYRQWPDAILRLTRTSEIQAIFILRTKIQDTTAYLHTAHTLSAHTTSRVD